MATELTLSRVISGSRVFVVVPAYREVERLPRVLESMPREVDHVIVVDDASRDGTLEVARHAGVIAIAHETNRGVGAAIATGYARALEMEGSARDAFVVMAGDGQMDPSDLPSLVVPIARGDADYVKGNRFASRGALREMPRTRYIGGRIFSELTRRALAIEIDDSQCGYTAISRAACERLDLASLWPRFGYPNDLLAMLVRKRIGIAEVPVRALYPHARNKLGARHVPMIGIVILRAWIRRRWG
jgi:glycosyltransferase involved in cell wall biosynthesis